MGGGRERPIVGNKTVFFGSPTPENKATEAREVQARRELGVAETFGKIREALASVNQVAGSQKTYMRAELLQIVNGVETAVRCRDFVTIERELPKVTDALGFRGALQRTVNRERVLGAINLPKTRETPLVDRLARLSDQKIPAETRLKEVLNLAEVKMVVAATTGLTGSRYYSPYELQQMVVGVEKALREQDLDQLAQAIRNTTKAAGLSTKIGALAQAVLKR